MLSALSQRRTLSPQSCISSHKMSEQSNKRAKPLSVPAQDFPFVRAESRFSCCQLEGCPLMYDRAILLMSKARQPGFLTFVSLSLGPDQLEAAHWPKEIRSGLRRLWCCAEWTNFWRFASVWMLSGVPALRNLTDLNTGLWVCIYVFSAWYLVYWHVL